MNGGVLHAVECLTQEQFEEAISGYRFYGFDSVASTFLYARNILASGEDPEDFESELDEQYYHQIPDDDFLDSSFRNHFLSNPSDYEPAEPTKG